MRNVEDLSCAVLTLTPQRGQEFTKLLQWELSSTELMYAAEVSKATEAT